MVRKKRNSIFRSKYSDVDLDSLEEEELTEVLRRIKVSIVVRLLGGLALFVLSLLALIFLYR